jgi:hypothetical protein
MTTSNTSNRTSLGIRKTSTGRYKVWWRLDDGTQGAKTFDSRSLARDFKNELHAQVAADSWTDPRRGRILFDGWADHWWQLCPPAPGAAQGHGNHGKSHALPPAPLLRPPPAPPDHPLDRAALATRAGGQAEPQRDDGVPVDPAAHPGGGPPRTADPDQPRPRRGSSQAADQSGADLRARAPADLHPGGVRPLPGRLPPVLPGPLPHQVGTGLRSGELLGLRRRRVYPELRRIEVIEVRYEAGRFGRGFKAEPKSPASIRVVPMCEQVRQAIGRQPPAGARPDDLVFPGPGGTNGIPRGARTPLSTHNLRRVYQAAVAAAGEDLAHLDLHGPPRPARPPRPAPHLRDLTGRRRHPRSGDRRADGPRRREAPGRRQWKSDGQRLPRDDADDARSCHRGPGRTDRPRDGSWRKSAARRRSMDRD